MMTIPPAGGNIWTNMRYAASLAGNDPASTSAATQTTSWRNSPALRTLSSAHV